MHWTEILFGYTCATAQLHSWQGADDPEIYISPAVDGLFTETH